MAAAESDELDTLDVEEELHSISRQLDVTMGAVDAVSDGCSCPPESLNWTLMLIRNQVNAVVEQLEKRRHEAQAA